MPLQSLTLTIPRGQSLSNGVNCGKGNVVLIEYPDHWDDANASFQISSDGNTWRDYFYINSGQAMPMGLREVVLPVGSNMATICQFDWAANLLWLKIRSGSAQRPIVQSADRTFTLTIDTN